MTNDGKRLRPGARVPAQVEEIPRRLELALIPWTGNRPRAVLTGVREAADGLELSARAWHRMLRVARTIADLERADDVDEAHVLEALC